MRKLPPLLLLAALFGCASPPQERFYTLTANVSPAEASAASAAGVPARDAPATDRPATAAAPYSLVVGPVALPVAVDRPQLVVRRDANQVTILEQERWAAPLKGEVARVIAADLSRLLGTPRAGTDAQNVIAQPDYRVTVDVFRFDAALGGAVAVEALWAVRAASGVVSNGRSQVSEVAQGDNYTAVVAAQSRALAAVSRDIAEAIRAQRTAAH